jgi:primase-polymerase (primpol)-like protein
MTLNTITEGNIPERIAKLDQWICWRADDRDGKPTKVPVKPYPTSGTPYASATDEGTWRDFETALTYHRESTSRTDGVGFVFDPEAGIVGVDLDNCRDPDTAELDSWAATLVERLDSYTEVSPSGTGLHILVEGTLPSGRNRRGDVEMYDRDRFFTVTGDHVDGTPPHIARRQDAILGVHREFVQTKGANDGEDSDERNAREDTTPTPRPVVGPNSGLYRKFGQNPPSVDDPALEAALHGLPPDEIPDPVPQTIADIAGPGVELSDDDLLERAIDSKSGATIQALLDGDAALWQTHESRYPSQSEADMGLCFFLGFWTGGDPERMDRLFRNSGLMREKWDRRHYGNGATYGDVCIARTLLKLDDYYSPPSDQTRSRRGRNSDPPTASVRGAEAHNGWDENSEAAGINFSAVEDAKRLATEVNRQQRQLRAYEDYIEDLVSQLRWYRAVCRVHLDIQDTPDDEWRFDAEAASGELGPRGEPASPPDGDLAEDAGVFSDNWDEEISGNECEGRGSEQEWADVGETQASESSTDLAADEPSQGISTWLRRWWR